MYQRILVPTDGSDLSAVAENAAIAFARSCGSELVALSIVPPEPAVLSAEGALVTGGAGVDALLAQAEAYVGRVADAAAKAGVACTTLTVYGYSPADEIVDAAKRTGCDLVFMASHGRRGLSRLIAGSVTQHVLAYSSVPVMVYRPQPAPAHGRPLHEAAPGR
ncbi:MAG: universal stress family protein [Massilia sp.]|jgi:nucleotide-binding universal stress UspA family protein|nr:universal stress family protein [Massilia sp.]